MELLWLVPILILLISLAQRWLGDRAGGRLAALPVTSTAVITVVTADQGTEAARAVAAGIVIGAPVGAAILLIYRWLATNALKDRPFRTVSVSKGSFRPWDLAVRVGVATGCVAGVSAAAHLFPPQVAGVFGAIPVVGCVLAAMTHRRAGPRAARDLLTGLLAGMPASLAFLATLATVLDVLPVPVAFGVAVMAGSAGHSLPRLSLVQSAVSCFSGPKPT